MRLVQGHREPYTIYIDPGQPALAGKVKALAVSQHSQDLLCCKDLPLEVIMASYTHITITLSSLPNKPLAACLTNSSHFYTSQQDAGHSLNTYSFWDQELHSVRVEVFCEMARDVPAMSFGMTASEDVCANYGIQKNTLVVFQKARV